MDVLDVIVIGLVIIAAMHGRSVGAAVQLVSFVGFLIGLGLGALLVVLIEPHVSGQAPKTTSALILLFIPAVVIGGLGRQIGIRLWQVLRRIRFGGLDAAGGMMIAVAGTLIACWLFASVLVNSSLPTLSRQIENSRIIRGVEAVLPPVPDAFSSVERYLSTSGFPQVLVNILPESVNPVVLPSNGQFEASVAAAQSSTVKIIAIGCGQQQEGSGFVVDTTTSFSLVVTNAHVIAGTGEISVLRSDGAAVEAAPVLFDPRFDLAILRTAPLGLAALSVDPGLVERGTDAAVLGYPEGGGFKADKAGVLARFDARGRDIYDSALTNRVVYQLQATVRPGNSGGPLVTPSGKVIGVVFSRSSTNPDIGFALSSPGVLQRIQVAEQHADVNTSTQGCTS